MSLAHVVTQNSDKPCQYGDIFDKRREPMELWPQYLNGL